MNVTSIVLNWNRRDDTLACLASLERQEVGSGRHRIMLVDNGSTDGSTEAARRVFAAIDVLELPRNVGYAAGYNAGIDRALARGADATLLVNNDTVAQPGLVEGLIVASRERGVGMAAPTVLHHDDPERVWPSAGWRRRSTLAAFDTTADPPSDEAYDVDWASGCCLLVRRELWESVGRFDERFFFYYEDHDLCLRAKAAGWRIVHVPRARILHRVARSTGEGSPRQAYLLARASVPYYAKHAHGPHRLLIAAYRTGSTARSVSEALAAGRPRVAAAYLRGTADGLADLARDLTRRAAARRTAA
ncbi:MAG: glycosyltransferase family 2 protein [Anaerolineae bacterium]